MAFNGPLTLIPNIDERIIEQIVAGKSILQLADQYQVNRLGIQRRAWRHPDYPDAIRTCVEARLAKREDELEHAGNNVAVTRADRLLGHARWLAERTCPDIYGDKRGGAGNVSVQVVIQSPSGNVQCNTSQVIDSVATPIEG